MPSVDAIPTTLTDNLRRLGLAHTADDLNDLVARATQKRWSPIVLLDTLVQAELEGRTRRRVERRLRDAGLGRFKSMADWDWTWPKQLPRPTLERVFTLDFLAKGENVILVGAQGLGKTMLAKHVVHQAVLAGHAARFLTASDLVLDLTGQDTARALERRLRTYTRPTLLAIDKWWLPGLRRPRSRSALSDRQSALRAEIDPRDHELTVQAVGHHLSQCLLRVALIDRLTHHAEIVPIDGDSYRRRDAELTHKSRRVST